MQAPASSCRRCFHARGHSLAIEEKQKEAPRHRVSTTCCPSFDHMSSTTLFNAGDRPQLSSCYLTTVPDRPVGIYHAIHDNTPPSLLAAGND
jgi:ribonucleotide reductase alpha subunit